MKLVTDGKLFAVQRGFWIFKKYACFVETGYWFPAGHRSSKWCWGSREEAEILMRELKPKEIRDVEDYF